VSSHSQKSAILDSMSKAFSIFSGSNAVVNNIKDNKDPHQKMIYQLLNTVDNTSPLRKNRSRSAAPHRPSSNNPNKPGNNNVNVVGKYRSNKVIISQPPKDMTINISRYTI
jgi:hypothetical protein